MIQVANNSNFDQSASNTASNIDRGMLEGAPLSALEFAVAFHRRLAGDMPECDLKQLAVKQFFQIATASGLSMDMMNRFYGIISKIERLKNTEDRGNVLQDVQSAISNLEHPNYYLHQISKLFRTHFESIRDAFDPIPTVEDIVALADQKSLQRIDDQIKKIKMIKFSPTDDLQSQHFFRKATLFALRVGKLGEEVYTPEKWRSTQILRQQIIDTLVKLAA